MVVLIASLLAQTGSEDAPWDIAVGLALVATVAAGAVILTVLALVRNRRDRNDAGRGDGPTDSDRSRP